MNRWKLVLVLIIAACGGGTSNTDGSGVDARGADARQDLPALTCKSIAHCSTYDVKTFLGTVPAPAGGTVKSGLYRLAWNLIPADVNEAGGYHDELEALAISGTSFNWASFHHDAVGTISTSGTTITFQETLNCNRGSDGSASTSMLKYTYTASGDELRIFSHVQRSDGVSWEKMYVYVLVSDPAEVCNAVANEPTTPGDSTQCRVSNCACKFAIDGTVNACT